MNELKISCYIKNMQDKRTNWIVSILVYDSSITSKEELTIIKARDIIENSDIDEREKRKKQKYLSAYNYINLMKKGYTYAEIYDLLRTEFNKYYDRPDSNTIVNAIAFEINCLNLAAKKIEENEMGLFEYINTEPIFNQEITPLIKKRNL